MPGLALTTTLGLVALVIAKYVPLPAPMIALALGAVARPLSLLPKIAPGASFAARSLLRTAVLLMAFRIDAHVAANLGWPVALSLVGLVAATLLFGFVLGRVLGLDASFAAVVAASTAICGAAAALAVSSVMPAEPDRDRKAAVAVAGVTVLSTVTMVLYPPLVRLLGFTPGQAAFFLGGSIADVAQVAGAGYALSPAVGDAAIATKLTRVLLLAPTVLLAASVFGTNRPSGAKVRLPAFVIGFFVLAVVTLAGLTPGVVRDAARPVADLLLAVAVAGLGVGLSPKAAAEVGVRPVILCGVGMIFIAAFAAIVSVLLCQ